FHNHFLKTPPCPSQLADALVEPLNRLDQDSSALTSLFFVPFLAWIICLECTSRMTAPDFRIRPPGSAMQNSHLRPATSPCPRRMSETPVFEQNACGF